MKCNGRPNIPWPAGYTPPSDYKPSSLPQDYPPKEVWYDRNYKYVDKKNAPPIVWNYVRDSGRLTKSEKLTEREKAYQRLAKHDDVKWDATKRDTATRDTSRGCSEKTETSTQREKRDVLCQNLD